MRSKVGELAYYIVYGWMVTVLKLRGTSLIVYAIIYGFSHAEGNEYRGSVQYLCDFSGCSSRTTITNALNELCEKKLILKRTEEVNGVTFPRYRVNPAYVPSVSKDCIPCAENLHGVYKNWTGGCTDSVQGGVQKLDTDNTSIDNTSKDNTRDSYYMGAFAPDTQKGAEKSHRFKAPTVEEVEAYCKERKNGIDAERFVDYYEMRGWKIGKTSMKDWKAAVRTWERNDKAKAEENPGAAHWDDLDDVLPG